MGEDDDEADADDSPTASYIRHDVVKGKNITDSDKPSGAKPKNSSEVRPALLSPTSTSLIHPSRLTTVSTSQGPCPHLRRLFPSPPTDTPTSPTPPPTVFPVRRPPMPHLLQIPANAPKWTTTQAPHHHPSLASFRRTRTHHHRNNNNNNTVTRTNLVSFLGSILPTVSRHRYHTATRCTLPRLSLRPRGEAPVVLVGPEVEEGGHRCTCYRRQREWQGTGPHRGTIRRGSRSRTILD